MNVEVGCAGVMYEEVQHCEDFLGLIGSTLKLSLKVDA